MSWLLESEQKYHFLGACQTDRYIEFELIFVCFRGNGKKLFLKLPKPIKGCSIWSNLILGSEITGGNIIQNIGLNIRTIWKWKMEVVNSQGSQEWKKKIYIK